MGLTKQDLLAIGKLLDKQRKAINQDIADFISDTILPQIDEILMIVNRIERKQDKQDDRLGEHSIKIAKLEKIHPGGKHPAQI